MNPLVFLPSVGVIEVIVILLVMLMTGALVVSLVWLFYWSKRKRIDPSEANKPARRSPNR